MVGVSVSPTCIAIASYVLVPVLVRRTFSAISAGYNGSLYTSPPCLLYSYLARPGPTSISYIKMPGIVNILGFLDFLGYYQINILFCILLAMLL